MSGDPVVGDGEFGAVQGRAVAHQLRDADQLPGAARHLPEADRHEEDGAEHGSQADEDRPR